MTCSENIAFPVIVIRQLPVKFKKKVQQWSKFRWVIEIRTSTVPGTHYAIDLFTVFYLLIAQEKKAKAAELAKELAERQKIADTAARLKVERKRHY